MWPLTRSHSRLYLRKQKSPQLHRDKTAEVSEEVFQTAEISAKKFHTELGKRKDRDLLGKIQLLNKIPEMLPTVAKICSEKLPTVTRICKDPQQMLPALEDFLPPPQKVSQT